MREVNETPYDRFLEKTESALKSFTESLPDHQKRIAFELSGQELIDNAEDDSEFLNLFDRADELEWSEFVKMMDRKTFRFRVDGAGNPSEQYDVTVRSPEALDNELAGFTITEIREMDDDELHDLLKDVIQDVLLNEDIEVLSEDPSYSWWGFAYLLNQFDSKYGPESKASTIPPNENNPGGLRFLDKHTYVLLKDIEQDAENLLDDMADAVARKLRAGTYRDI